MKKQIKTIFFLLFLAILLLTQSSLSEEFPDVIDRGDFTEEVLNGKEVWFQDKEDPTKTFSIATEQEIYRCLPDCKIKAVINNSFFEAKDLDDFSIKYEDELNQVVEGEKFKEDLNETEFEELEYFRENEINEFTFDIDVPLGTEEIKFNITVENAGISYTLDPAITSGCTEANAVVECTGAITGNSYDTDNASIYIHDAVITATTGSSLRLNTTHGYINITKNVTINAYGSAGSAGGGCSSNGGTGGNGNIELYANESHPIKINTSTLNAYGGAGGAGATCTLPSVNEPLSSKGGSGGKGLILFSNGSLLNITHSTLNAYGGDGGEGGDSHATGEGYYNCELNGYAVSGNGASGNQGNITAYMEVHTTNSTLNYYGGDGGDSGDSYQDGGYIECLRGNTGGGGIGRAYFSNSNLGIDSSILTGYSGTIGTIGSSTPGTCGCGSPGGSLGSHSNSHLDMIFNIMRFYTTTLNASVGKDSETDATGRSYAYFEVSEYIYFENTIFKATQPNTNYHILNLTNETEAKLAFFNGSDILDTTYVHCDAPDIIYGNDSTVTAPDPQLDWTNCPAYADGNISYVNYDVFFNETLGEVVTIDITSPQDNYYSITQLRVNYTANSDFGNDFSTIRLFINDSLNTTETNVANGTNANISSVGLPNGTFSWVLEACSNESICENTTTRTFYLDDTVPAINFFEPSNNISVYNLSTNIEVSGANLEDINFTVFFSNGTKHYSNNTSSPSSPFTISDSVNFDVEDNYTINVTANNTAESITSRLNYYYFDMTAPTITMSQPTGEKSSRTVTLTTTYIENSTPICFYWVTTSLGASIGLDKESYNCLSASFAVANDGDFIAFANITDGLYSDEVNSSFSVDTSVPAPPPAEPPGGGGAPPAPTVPELPTCDVDIEPETVYLSTTETLQEIKITNNEDLSYTPEVEIKTVEGEKDYKDSLEITNVPGTILKDMTVSIGLLFTSDETEEGENLLVFSSTTCKDIEVPIKINTIAITERLEEIFDPDKTTLENLIDISTEPLIDFEPIKFIKLWWLTALAFVVLLIITYNKIIKKHKGDKRGFVIFIVILDVVLSVAFTFIYLVITKLF